MKIINRFRHIFLHKYLELKLYIVFHLNQENYDLIIEILYMIYAHSQYTQTKTKTKLSSNQIKIIIELVIRFYHKSVSNNVSCNESIISDFFEKTIYKKSFINRLSNKQKQKLVDFFSSEEVNLKVLSIFDVFSFISSLTPEYQLCFMQRFYSTHIENNPKILFFLIPLYNYLTNEQIFKIIECMSSLYEYDELTAAALDDFSKHPTFEHFVIQLGNGDLNNGKIRLAEQLFEMVNQKRINIEVMDMLIEGSNIFSI